MRTCHANHPVLTRCTLSGLVAVLPSRGQVSIWGLSTVTVSLIRTKTIEWHFGPSDCTALVKAELGNAPEISKIRPGQGRIFRYLAQGPGLRWRVIYYMLNVYYGHGQGLCWKSDTKNRNLRALNAGLNGKVSITGSLGCSPKLQRIQQL